MHTEKKVFTWTKILSLIGLIWIASGHFLPLKIPIGGREIIINTFSEFYLIPVFGIWRILKEKDPFQKKRIKWMMVLFGWKKSRLWLELYLRIHQGNRWVCF